MDGHRSYSLGTTTQYSYEWMRSNGGNKTKHRANTLAQLLRLLDTLKMIGSWIIPHNMLSCHWQHIQR